MTEVANEITVALPPNEAWSWFTEAEPLGRWMAATDVTAEPVPGGSLGWTHENGHSVRGEFVELRPYSLIRFSFGWADGWLGVQAGSTDVTVTLTPDPSGGTRVRLVHRGLEVEPSQRHLEGWTHFMSRLAALAGPAYCRDGEAR